MKRRSFLKFLGLSSAAAAVAPLAAERAVGKSPLLVAPYGERIMTATEIAVLNSTRFYYDVYNDRWIGHAVVGDIVAFGTQYEYAMAYKNEPTREQKIQFHEIALVAFQRAQRKYG